MNAQYRGPSSVTLWPGPGAGEPVAACHRLVVRASRDDGNRLRHFESRPGGSGLLDRRHNYGRVSPVEHGTDAHVSRMSLTHSLRSLRRTPVFAATAAVTLALGIG